ncbi:MAG TPA: alpha/beta hydrolase-fold protein [Gemmatimonas sp.]|nr:alpha/beta hydrolase-fold protein [Gemmatimonas sp.]
MIRSLSLAAAALVVAGCAGSSSGVRTTLPVPAAASYAASPYAAVAIPAGDTSRVLRLRVTSKALAGNLLGDSATRTALVYLPPDYATSSSKRYRTLYLLHGFGAKRNGQNTWLRGFEGFHLGHTMDSLYRAGSVRDLIVIAPDGSNFWGGAFYRDSPVAGGWETFIVRELVGTIDATFRTIRSRDSRGIAGHSMGGYGTLTMASKFPDVFGAAYAMSPCCIAPAKEAGELAPVWRLIAGARDVASVSATGFYGGAMMGLAAAYSPNPAKAPLYVDSPFRAEGNRMVLDTAVANRWMAQAPLRLMDSLSGNLAKLRALGFDAGRGDNFKDIPVLVPVLDSLLTAKGVKHTTTLYDGDHNNRIGTRLPAIVLPFFNAALARQ